MPYPVGLVFGVARDVNHYPEFLPWCSGARIFNEQKISDTSGQFDADLVIGFKMFKERFTSRVTFTENQEVRSEFIKGPMKYCINHWIFTEVSRDQTQVEFFVDFTFSSKLLQSTIEIVFLKATQKMMRAFKDRTAELAAKQ